MISFAMVALVAPLARSEGFRNPPAGAFNLGRAGGRIAQIDDASAVAQNPANLVDLKNAEFQFAPSAVYIKVDYQSPAGASTSTRDPWKLLPNLFASIPIPGDTFAAGIGITTPFGLSNEWDPALNSPFRYTAPHFTELKTINVNPTLSARLGERVTIGLGVDVMWSELTLKQFLSPMATTFEAKGKGDGLGLGGNIGLTWQLTDSQRLALTYRSPVTVDYRGNFDLNNLPLPGGGGSRSDFNSRINFPTIIAAGYGVNLSPTVRLEADVEWLQFSRFKSLPITVGSNPVGFPSTTVAQNWKDTFTAGIGGDWQFTPGWTLRGGYQFYQSPVPDSTFSPTIPDANQNVLTVGLNYKTKRHSLEFAYGADLYDDRHITQTVAFNGDYRLSVHLFAFSYRFLFR